jgi:sugar O-acyltransferase (sialic acid O-acetyltransferase NeuD family)
MDDIVVVGGGGHAKVLMCILRKAGWSVLGYTDKVARGTILDISYLGIDDALPDILRKHRGCAAVIGVGKIDASDLRLRLQRHVESHGFRFPVIVSPRSVVNDEVTMEAGTAVFDGVVINSGTNFGRGCILNTNCTVEHDCTIGDNVHIAPGATISGGVTIGHNTMIGAGAVVIHSVSICDGCLIGAGSTVLKDITQSGIYVGTPAVRVRR